MTFEEIREALQGKTIQEIYKIADEAGVHGNTLYRVVKGYGKRMHAGTREKIAAVLQR